MFKFLVIVLLCIIALHTCAADAVVLAKQSAMVNSWMEMDDCSYEQFCDKYAHELNH